MAAPNSVSVGSGHMVPAFAKLEGKNFVYFIQKYSIILGRSTETSKVDFDLSELGGGRDPHVSRHHACIFYDFERNHFALEVLGKNGCSIQEVSYPLGSDPVKLNSQDLIEIAGNKFYFLLPICSIFATLAAWDYPGRSYADEHGGSNGENGRSRRFTGELDINADPTGTPGECDKDTDNQLLLEEEKDVVSALIVLIPYLCSPRGWVPMEKLYSELLERFGKNWPSARVTRYLPQMNGSGSSTETEGKPWCSLLPLLRKYPEHFVMGTVTRGEVTSEFVALVSLVSLGNGPFSAF